MSALSFSASKRVNGVSSVALSADFLFQNLLLGESVESWVDIGRASSCGSSSQNSGHLGDCHSIVDLSLLRNGLSAREQIESDCLARVCVLKSGDHLLINVCSLSLHNFGLAIKQIKKYLYHL